MNKTITEYGLGITIMLHGQPVYVEYQIGSRGLRVLKISEMDASMFVESSLKKITYLTECAHKEERDSVMLTELTGGI